MERRDLAPEDENVFETTSETPPLVRDFVNAGLDYESSSDMIPNDELRLFSRPLLGANSLSHQLFDEFKDGVTPVNEGERFMLDLNIVPSPESTDETNVIEDEYGDNYIVSDAYARYRMRLVAIHEPYRTPRGDDSFRYRIVHVGVRDKLEKGNGLELFLNHDDSVDAGFAVDGRYSDRRPATPCQQWIVAAMVSELLNPVPLYGNEPDPEIESDSDIGSESDLQ